MSYWMVPAAWVMIPAVFAGFLHGVTGFGFGMVIMLFLPVAFSMQMATALSQSLSLVLCSCMLFCYRREARLKRVILPLLFYFPCFFLFLTVADRIDTSFLKPALGVLLFFLAVYLFWFSGRASIKANGKTAFLCAFLAAFLDAFFAILAGHLWCCIFCLLQKERRSIWERSRPFLQAAASMELRCVS